MRSLMSSPIFIFSIKKRAGDLYEEVADVSGATTFFFARHKWDGCAIMGKIDKMIRGGRRKSGGWTSNLLTLALALAFDRRNIFVIGWRSLIIFFSLFL